VRRSGVSTGKLGPINPALPGASAVAELSAVAEPVGDPGEIVGVATYGAGMPESGSAAQATLTRAQVIAFRWHAHQLDRPPGSAAGLDDVALLDFGIQDTGQQAARWALTNRGLESYRDVDTLLGWTIRVSPHLYRRTDTSPIARATAPLSEADAARRIYDAAKPLRAAGLGVLDALAVVAKGERAIVKKPTVKGELSTALTAVLDPPYLRRCNPCDAIHAWESPFRMAALQAGLELRPGTSPPVLQRISGFDPPLLARTSSRADSRFDVIRNYLRFYGPAGPKDVAAFLDAPVKEIAARWPADAVPVAVTGAPGVSGERSMLADDLQIAGSTPEKPGAVRILGPYDGYLQLRDRPMLVGDTAHAKDLWRVLGRPGAVALDGEIIGTWRPKSSGTNLTVRFEPWLPTSKARRAEIAEQARRLAAVRGLELTELTGT